MYLNATNPILDINNPMFPIIVSCAGIIISVVISNRVMRYKINKDNQEKLNKKANLEYVDQQDRGIHKRVNRLEQNNVDLGKKIDDNHNFVIQLLTDLNTNVLKALSNKK